MNSQTMPQRVDLHNHLGAAVDPAIMWSIAHTQGIKLPSKNYWDFEKLITIAQSDDFQSMAEVDKQLFYWTELIQSSPVAVETSVQSVIGGGYRKCNITVHELRFNPMKRNRGGEQDLDHIIMAALRGMDRAILEYPQVKAGLILMLDRTFPYALNEIIMHKALKYKNRGIVGLDIAGPQVKKFQMKKYVGLFKEARKQGLGITIHTGEEGNLAEMRQVVKLIKPDRIGHGFLCWQDKKLMKDLVKHNITLELCPTSNLKCGVIKSLNEERKIYQTLHQNKVKLTINTDGPEMYRTNLFKELEFLQTNNIFSQADIDRFMNNARKASFIKQ
ncbi:MAG: adenosine deaminase [Candidatus Komeilibacteria bacterium]|nr:adenosine deaminase [Candidatus Komeilibacteria bacterium]